MTAVILQSSCSISRTVPAFIRCLKKLSSQVYHYKEISEGGNHMASVFDEVLEEALNDGRNESRKEMAIALLKDKIYPLNKIAELTKLPLEEVEALQKAI